MSAADYSAFAQFVHHHWGMLIFLAWVFGLRGRTYRIDSSLVQKWRDTK